MRKASIVSPSRWVACRHVRWQRIMATMKEGKSNTASQVASLLGDLLVERVAEEILPTKSIRSFRDAGLFTEDAGLVIRLPDGSEYQITVVQSR